MRREKSSKRLLLTILACAGLVITSASAALALSASEKADIFSRAKSAFEEGNSLREKDAASARLKHALAAQLFERIARDGAVRNGKLYYNIGNSYFLQDKIGQAILNYRKAEKLITRHGDLKRNLNAARIMRKDQIETPAQKKILEILFFWHYDFSLYVRFIMFAVCFGILWIISALPVLRPGVNVRRPVAAAAILSAVLAASVLVEEYTRATTREGVILGEEIIARKGDSESYSPSFNSPLHEGTEFTLTDQRKDWLHIRLMDGRTCWIPRSAVGLIDYRQ